jgi:hypothetical protein
LISDKLYFRREMLFDRIGPATDKNILITLEEMRETEKEYFDC